MGYLKTVDIKSDMPDLKEALRRLDSSIKMAKSLKAGAVKIIHGYGSTGAGGKIRRGVQKQLSEMRTDCRVCSFIPGEEFSIFNEETRKAFVKCPELRSDEDLDRHNNGITIVVL